MRFDPDTERRDIERACEQELLTRPANYRPLTFVEWIKELIGLSPKR